MKRRMINWIFSGIKNNENVINILLIFISIFVVTIMPLNAVPVDFKNADNYHEALTAFSAKIVNNWLIDGIVNDKFIMFDDFASVEFETNNNRRTYSSYPSGSLIPIYIIAKVIGVNEVSTGFIKHFVQFEYYLSIFILGLLFYICLKIIDVKSRLLIIILPIILSSLWAFLPFNVYYMKNAYFVDQAVILLSIMFFLIEFALYNKKLIKWKIPLHMLSCIVLFAGILTDYYFFCIAFVACCFRIIIAFQDYPEKPLLYKLFSNTWALIISAIIATALFIIQLLNVPDGFDLLALTFSIRAGSGEDFGGIKALINHFNNGFSVFSLPTLILVTIFCGIFIFIRNNYNQEKQMIVRWLSIIVLSTVLHTIILREHSIVHEFSMIKYNLVFVFIIFAFICWIYISYMTNSAGGIKKYSSIALTFIVCLLPFCFLSLKNYDQNFYKKRIWKEDHSIAEFIRENTNYYDVVYSPDYEINCHPTQNLAISRKRIYKVLSLDEIPVKSLPNQAIINILISRKTIENHNWSKLHTEKIFSEKLGNFYLFKFSKESFQSINKLK